MFGQAVLLGIVFLVALAASLLPIIRSPVTLRNGFGPFGDSYLYHAIAYNLYEGHGFSGTDDGRALGLPHPDAPLEYQPAVARGPVYPVFLCAVYTLFGSREAMGSVDTWHVNWDRVRIVQCVLQAIACLFVFGIARTMGAPLWPAWTAALIQAVCFYNIYYTRMLLSESVTTFVVTAFILCGVRALKTRQTRWWLAAGALLGVTILARAEYSLFVPVLAAYVLMTHRPRTWAGVREVAWLVATVVCVVAPWTLRNYRVTHQFVPVSVGGLGPCLYTGTFESKNTWKDWGVYADEVFYRPGEAERFRALSAAFDERFMKGSIDVQPLDRAFTRMALERIRDRPLACVANWVAKAPRLWYQDYIPMYLEREASGRWFLIYFVFAVLAFGLCSKEERMLIGFVALLFVYMNGVFLPLHVEPRFGVALMPGIIALTGIGLGRVATAALRRVRRA